MPDQGAFTFVVDAKDSKKRLDFFISSLITDCSRSLAASLINDGIIRVDSLEKKPGYKLKAGEKVTGYIPSPEQPVFEPEPVDLDILYEDKHIIVLNKQAGLVVHPAPGHYSGTLVNGLLFHCSDLKGIGGELRPGIVHRLDKDTTGVLAAAKNQEAHAGLSSSFKEREVKKKYLAVVYGDFADDNGKIELPIGRHPNDRKKMSTNSRRSRDAETLWEVKERFDGITLLEINIKTGRTHQIRVHCASIHHPVVGDPVYCGKKAAKNFIRDKKVYGFVKPVSRQMLHAQSLAFIHPVTGEKMLFEAPLPEDMETLIDGLRAYCKGSL